MEVDKEIVEKALDDVLHEILSDAEKNNSSAFILAATNVIHEGIKDKLIEKLFGGKSNGN